MPQMSPIFWSLILTMSTMLLLQLNSMNFFESINKPNFKTKSKSKKNNEIKWKW